tara:strand:- start:1526 stop:1936 length:411 start_codon:yes stop_codon:yes gene_type:complete
MGNSNTINKINFKDMQIAIKNKYIIINTLDSNNQDCLIENTLSINDEIQLLNNKNLNKTMNIIIYGMNSIDESIIVKYNQLISLGFKNIYIYTGGLFEWLLLQDIYSNEYFKTSNNELDILKYKGREKIDILMIEH